LSGTHSQNDGMSVYWLAMKIGILLAFIGLATIPIRLLLSKKRAGTFTCFILALGAVSILRAAAAILLYR
jgi:uncharacterized membrane protein SirB2